MGNPNPKEALAARLEKYEQLDNRRVQIILPHDLLERVDAAKATSNRSAFIRGVLERHFEFES